MNGASPCHDWPKPRVVKHVLLHVRDFFTWSISRFTTPFDPSVLSRQTKPHCGLRQFWGQFCLMLFLDLRACQITLKKCSFRSGRFWGRSDRNSFCFDLFLEKNAHVLTWVVATVCKKIVRQRDAILTSCWFARRQITSQLRRFLKWRSKKKIVGLCSLCPTRQSIN